MHQGKYVFSQIMDFVDRYQFDQCVERYNGEFRIKHFTCWEQFLALAFGQLSFRESLRDIIVCLGAHREKLYHLGFHKPIALPTLARANEKRDWRIFRDFAEILIKEARKLYGIKPHPGKLVTGTLWLLTNKQRWDICQWELTGLWSKNIKVTAQINLLGLKIPIKAQTEFLPNQESLPVPGDKYKTFIVPKEKLLRVAVNSCGLLVPGVKILKNKILLVLKWQYFFILTKPSTVSTEARRRRINGFVIQPTRPY
ncbi:MAG: DUF4372 domain-containing protein [Candidatus Uhrbacteria bacterium]